MVTTASRSAEIESAAAILAAAEAQLDGWLPAEHASTHPGADRSPGADLLVRRLRQVTSASPSLKIVVSGSELYPHNLAAVPGRPALLFIDGLLTDDDRRAIAIVGSRASTPEVFEMARSVAEALAEQDLTIVSGLARGVDTAVHQGALAGSGRTVAVMGTGIGAVFPPENLALSERIKAHGALVSQFPPGYGPTKTTFPARNAVIAGMSLASLIMTASERSGTRIELDYTLAMGRPVLLWKPTLERAPWAQRLGEKPLVSFVSSADEIGEALSSSLVA
jgi:DNA processing protein